jgi:hypothetical protein
LSLNDWLNKWGKVTNVASNPDFYANVVPKAKGLEHLRGYDKAYPTSEMKGF